MERGETAAIVGRAVGALPPLQREVLILSEYEELSLAEIARAVDSGIGTVKSRLHRARENLRRMLAPLKPASVTKLGVKPPSDAHRSEGGFSLPGGRAAAAKTASKAHRENL